MVMCTWIFLQRDMDQCGDIVVEVYIDECTVRDICPIKV